jgi:hypothetical protein
MVPAMAATKAGTRVAMENTATEATRVRVSLNFLLFLVDVSKECTSKEDPLLNMVVVFLSSTLL